MAGARGQACGDAFKQRGWVDLPWAMAMQHKAKVGSERVCCERCWPGSVLVAT